MILKQTFFRFIIKAMNHSSLIISCVAELSIRNPLSICSTNLCQILNECDTRYDVSANDIGRAGLAGLSSATMARPNVNVL